MKKKKLLVLIILFLLSFTISFPQPVYADNDFYLGGMTAGFSMNTEGATIVGFSDVITEKGIESPSKNSGININDTIIKIDDKLIDNANDIEKAINGKNNIRITIKRDDFTIEKNISPVKDLSGNYKLGIFIRNDVCGIGTITFIKGNKFASLGHAVLNENEKMLDVKDGTLFNCSISGVIKGQRGKAGELKGIFLKTNPIGFIEKNTENGVYGSLSRDFNKKDLKKINTGKATVGEATIYSTISGITPKGYSIMIVKNDNYSTTKNYVIKITDDELLSNTNGIVQGMSGSPIVQNGKLVGAVTHVFINDPTRGFGISINNMIDNIA